MSKQIIIILVGHDNSGKSHIAKALSQSLSLPIFKMDTPKKFWDPVIAQRYASEAITQVFEQTKASAILDRGFPCDYMYSKLFNRPFDYEKNFETDARFAKMNTLIVLCYKSEAKHLDDEEDRVNFQITTKDYYKMTDTYREFKKQSQCRWLTLNTDDENLGAQLLKITDNL